MLEIGLSGLTRGAARALATPSLLHNMAAKLSERVPYKAAIFYKAWSFKDRDETIAECMKSLEQRFAEEKLGMVGLIARLYGSDRWLILRASFLPILVLLFRYGLRPSEAGVVKVSCWDSRLKILTLEDTKSEEGRAIPIDDDTARLLDLSAFNRPADSPLFYTQKLMPWSTKHLASVLRRLVQKFAIRNPYLYDLRHTAITLLARQMKGNYSIVKRISGHKSDVCFGRYLLDVEGDEQEVRNVFNAKRLPINPTPLVSNERGVEAPVTYPPHDGDSGVLSLVS